MAVHVALLRAVNVGGRSVPMAGLRELLDTLGFAGARTILQSGNAVFASARSAASVKSALEKGIASRFGLETDVLVRSARELGDAIAANPFPREADADPARLVLVPLERAPSGAQVDALRAAVKGRERVAVDGRHAYLVYPDGIGTSKLTLGIVEARLGTRGTARNWNTVLKLSAAASELGSQRARR